MGIRLSVEFSLAAAIAIILFFVAGKNNVLLNLLLLAALAGFCLHPILGWPWIWMPASTAMKLWRVSLIITVVLLAVSRFGIWVWPISAQQSKQEESKARQSASQVGEESKQERAQVRAMDSAAASPPKGAKQPHEPKPARTTVAPRHVNAEQLGKKLATFGGVTAAIWNDGTNEPGALAKQIEIGLGMAKWNLQDGGSKMSDAAWFPDSLTIEISSKTEPSQEIAHKAAGALKKVLKSDFQIDSQIRYTDQVFPENFMRIKVASQ